MEDSSSFNYLLIKMGQKKKIIYTSLKVWYIIALVFAIILIVIQSYAIVNMTSSIIDICSHNSSNYKQKYFSFSCSFYKVMTSIDFVGTISTFSNQFFWIMILYSYVRAFKKKEAKSENLELQIQDLTRQLNEMDTNNYATSDVISDRELPNEREPLLTQNHLMNYRAT